MPVRSPWVLLCVSCATALSLMDALLIGRTTNLFVGGFLALEPRWTVLHFGVFLVASLGFDVALVLSIWLVVLPVLRRLPLGSVQRLVLAGLLALGPPIVVLYVRYQLSRFLGDVIDAKLLMGLAGGSPVEWFAQASGQLVPVSLAVAAAVLASALGVRTIRAGSVAREAAAALEVPGPRRLSLLLLAAIAFTGVVLIAARLRGGSDYRAFELKSSGALLAALYERLTDFDLDGYGLFTRPVDQAPFDSSLHPYALDVPGNGIDENGVAGDHPLDFRAPPSELNEQPSFGYRPNMLVIFLEGVRADLIGERLGDREIMPFLSRLAAEGARSNRAFANSPLTWLSRAQMMGGRLVPYAGESTLIDDFKRNGYEVAWFSGQDESFGLRESAMLGLARADVHYDARDDKEHSVSIFSTSGSLMVSWKRVNEKVDEYLAARRDTRPLLLYVNYGDTHFPYSHRELDDVLGAPRLARIQIQPERRAEVFATYANAAANVDRAIEHLVGRWRELLGPDGAVLVTSDHGEALFEGGGGLGHGLALDHAQSQVPLVLFGLPGDWPEPIGMSDLRGAIQRALQVSPAEKPPRPRFAPVPGRRIFQYMASIEEPRLLAVRSADSELRWDSFDPPLADPDFPTLIWWWESLQLENAASGR